MMAESDSAAGKTVPPRTPIIGIIGPPCSGKSTVARHLESLGGIWLNADEIAKDQLTKPDVIEKLIAMFGGVIQSDDGTLSRPRLADLVFGDDEASLGRLRQLESVLHPRTRTVLHERIQEAAAKDALFVILDVPLLLENGWQSECDEIWCLRVSPEQHGKLIEARSWDATELQRRGARQWSWQRKEKASTRVIENDGSVDDLHRRVGEAITDALRN